jgi:hypothetical protein
MPNVTTLNETLRSPESGDEYVRVATAGANWKRPLKAIGQITRPATTNLTMLDRSKLAPATVQERFRDPTAWYATVIPAGLNHLGWIANLPNGLNFGDAAWSQPGDGTNTVIFNDPTFNGGCLKISLHQIAGGAWRGGNLCSTDVNGFGFAPTDGYFEYKVKLPVVPVQTSPSVPGPVSGPWVGLWLGGYVVLPTLYCYNITTELDLIEWYAAFANGFHTSYHLWHPSGNDIFPFNSDNLCWYNNFPGGTPALGLAADIGMTQFNTYGQLIDRDWCITYFNDIQVCVRPRNQYSKFPNSVLITMAAGGAGGSNPLVNGTGPFDMYVTEFNYYPLA